MHSLWGGNSNGFVVDTGFPVVYLMVLSMSKRDHPGGLSGKPTEPCQSRDIRLGLTVEPNEMVLFCWLPFDVYTSQRVPV